MNWNPFAAAYAAGWRAGATTRTEVINGLRYIKTAVCPFTLWRPISWAVWHEGHYVGQMKSLTTKGF